MAKKSAHDIWSEVMGDTTPTNETNETASQERVNDLPESGRNVVRLGESIGKSILGDREEARSNKAEKQLPFAKKDGIPINLLADEEERENARQEVVKNTTLWSDDYDQAMQDVIDAKRNQARMQLLLNGISIIGNEAVDNYLAYDNAFSKVNFDNVEIAKSIADAKASDAEADDITNALKKFGKEMAPGVSYGRYDNAPLEVNETAKRVAENDGRYDIDDTLNYFKRKDEEGRDYYEFNGKRLYSTPQARAIVKDFVDEHNHWIDMKDTDYREAWAQKEFGVSFDTYVDQVVKKEGLDDLMAKMKKTLNELPEDIEFPTLADEMPTPTKGNRMAVAIGQLQRATESLRKPTFWNGMAEGFMPMLQNMAGDWGDVINILEQNRAIEKSLKGEPLTTEEQLLVDMFEYEQKLEELRGMFRPNFDANKFASGTLQSAGYAANILFEGALLGGGYFLKEGAETTVKEAFEQGLRTNLKEGVKQATKVAGRQALSRSADDAVKILANTNTYRGYADRRQQQYSFVDGTLIKKETNPFADFYRAYMDAYAERLGEAGGDFINDGFEILGRAAAQSRMFGKVARPMMKVMDYAPVAVVKQGLRQARVQNFAGEVFGEYMTSALQPLMSGDLFTTWSEDGYSAAIDKHYSELLSKDTALSTIAICGAMSGAGTVIKLGSGIYAGVEMNSLKNKVRNSLEKISDEALRNEVYLAINNNDYSALANLNWAGIDDVEDIRNATSAIFNSAKAHYIKGELSEVERINTFMPIVQNTIESCYMGADMGNPKPTTDIISLIDSQGQSVGNVMFGNLEDADATLTIRRNDGQTVNISRAELAQQGITINRTSVGSYIAEQYALMFGKDIAKERLAEVMDNVRGYRNMSEEAQAQVLKDNGFSVHKTGEVVTLADGRQGIISGESYNGYYGVEVADANGKPAKLWVGFENILSNDPDMAQAQLEAMAEGSIETPVALPTDEKGNIKLNEIENGKTLAMVLPAQLGSKHYAVAAIDTELARLDAEGEKAGKSKAEGLDAIAEAKKKAEARARRISALEDARKRLTGEAREVVKTAEAIAEERNARQAEKDAMSTFDFSRDYRSRMGETKTSAGVLRKFAENTEQAITMANEAVASLDEQIAKKQAELDKAYSTATSEADMERIAESTKDIQQELDRLKEQRKQKEQEVNTLKHRNAQYKQTLRDMGANADGETFGANKAMVDIVEKANSVFGIPIRMGTAEDFENDAQQNAKHIAPADGGRGYILINPLATNLKNGLGIISHEMVHELKTLLTPEEWTEFENLVMTARYGENWKESKEYNDEFIDIKTRYARANKPISNKKCAEEMMCYSFEEWIFGGAEGAKRFEDVINNHSQKNKIRAWFKSLIDKIRTMFGKEIDNPEMQNIKECVDAFARFVKKYDAKPNEDSEESNKDVSKEVRKAQYEAAKHPTKSANGEESHSLATYHDWVDDRGMAHKGTRTLVLERMERDKFSNTQQQDMLNRMDTAFEYMAKLQEMTDENGNVRFDEFNEWAKTTPHYKLIGRDYVKAITSLVSNGDYPINLEITTDCIKREAFTKLLNELAKRGVDLSGMEPAQIVTIQKMMKQYGIEVACNLCFVEGKRLGIVNWAQTIVEDWNDALVEAGVETDEYFGFGKDGEVTVPTTSLTEAVKDGGKLKEMQDAIFEIGYIMQGIDDKAILEQKMKNDADIKAYKLQRAKEWSKKFKKPKPLTDWKPTKADQKYMDELAQRGMTRKYVGDNANDYSEAFNRMRAEWIEKNPKKDSLSFTPTQKQWDVLEKIRNRMIETVKAKMVRLIMEHPEMRKKMRLNDLLGSKGLMEIRHQDGQAFADLWSILLQRFGTGTPKPVQDATPYDGEVMGLTESAFEKANKIGGARLFSFSDFDITKVFDYMQMFFDLEANKQKLQSYTKEVPAVIAFGRSNAKMNISTLANAFVPEDVKAEYAKANEKRKKELQHQWAEYAGLLLDEDGNIVGINFSEEHSVKPEFAQQIFHDDTRNKDCGAIMVGDSVNHAIYSAAQDWIRMVIPFHLSGMPLAAREKTDVLWYTDNTSYQSTRKRSGAEGWTKLKDDPFNFYDTMDQKGWNMRDKAREYLAWCAENDYRPKFDWGINSDYYRAYCEENGYMPNQQIIDMMDADTTDGVWNQYYKFLADFTAYKPVFNEKGEMIDEIPSPQMPVKANFDFSEMEKDVLFEGEDSMLAHRESNIQHTQENLSEIADRTTAYLKGEVTEEEMALRDDVHYKNTADAELYLDALESSNSLQKQPNTQEVVSDADVVESYSIDRSQSVEEIASLAESEGTTSFSLVRDEAKIAELEASPKVVGYRNVILNEDGSFSSPMATHIGNTGKGKVKSATFNLGEWEEAEENPQLVDEQGKVYIYKDNGGSVKVAYDPYIHNRLDKVNAQFKEAWKRPNLVYVETEVPITDLESGYHADKAKLPVGVHSWSNGDLMLSRYDKPIRIVPWEEVADDWVARFKDRGVEFDIVPPALLPILKERGVEILPPHKGLGADATEAYEASRTKQSYSVNGDDKSRQKIGATKGNTSSLDQPFPTRRNPILADYGAKLNKNYESAIDDIIKLLEAGEHIGGDTFLRLLDIALANRDKVSKTGSDYVHLGNGATLRISNHYAIVENFYKKNNTKENYGIVIKGDGKKRYIDDKRVDYLEYAYFPDKMDGAGQKALLDGLKQFVKTGDFEGSLPHPDKIHASGEFKGKVVEQSNSLSREREDIERVARENGTWLKAPNGKDTNLSPEQWVTIRTKAFKEWFGDWENDPESASKVVDENGEPKVVYHQTNGTVYINRETGENWDELNWQERDAWDERDDWEEYWEEQDFYTFSRVNARTTNELDGFFFAPEYDEYHEYGERTIPAFLNIRKPASKEDYMVDATYNNAGQKERIRMQNEGYDGVVYVEDDGRVVEYIAFEPNQIKSATENIGTFDSAKDDIRFSLNRNSLTTIATPAVVAGANPSDATRDKIDALRNEIEERIDRIATTKNVTFEEIEKMMLDESDESEDIRKWVNEYNRASRKKDAQEKEAGQKAAEDALQQKFGLSIKEAKRKVSEAGTFMTAIQKSAKNRYNRIIKAVVASLKASPSRGVMGEDVAIWVRRAMTQVYLDVADANLKATQRDVKSILTKEYEKKNSKGEKEGKLVDYVAANIVEQTQSFVKQFYQRINEKGDTVIDLGNPTLLWKGVSRPDVNAEIDRLAAELDDLQKEYDKAENANASEDELNKIKEKMQICEGVLELLDEFRIMCSIAEDIAGTENNIKEVRNERNELRNKEWRNIYKAKTLVQSYNDGKIDAQKALTELQKLGYGDVAEAQQAIDGYEQRLENKKSEIFALQRQLASDKLALLDATKDFNTAVYGIEAVGRIAFKEEKENLKKQKAEWRAGILRSVRNPLFANTADYDEENKRIKNANGKKYTWWDNARLRSRGDAFIKDMTDTLEFVARKMDVMSIPNAWLHTGLYYQFILHPEFGVLARADWRYFAERQVRAMLDLRVASITGYKSVDKLRRVLNKDLGIAFDIAATDKDGKVKAGADFSNHKFTVDEALYIRAVIRQEGVLGGYYTIGLDKDKIDQIVAEVESKYPRLCDLADWVQGEDGIYERLYTMNNEVYRKKNGRDLDHNPQYCPIRRKSNTVPTESNLGDAISVSRLANGIGSNKKRVRNNIAMDVNARFFGVLDEHIGDVIQWIAYADLFDKMNTLLGSPMFKKMMQVQGISKTNLENCFLRAAGERLGESETGRWAKVVNALAKNAVASNVVANLNSAMKQFVGITAALSTNISPEIYWHFVKNFPLITNMTTIVEKGWRKLKNDDIHKEMDVVRGNYVWALKNIPTFAERVDTGSMGMDIFQRDGFKTWDKVADFCKKYGMAANKFMDTIVSASVAKTVYEMEYKKLRRRGMTHEQAHDDARFMASVLVNQTQQSVQGAFLSALQSDRKGLAGTIASTTLTAYNNNQFAMDRNARAAMLNLLSLGTDGGNKQRVEMLAKEYEERGLSPAKAKRWAKWDLWSALLAQAKILLHNTTINPIVWAFTPNVIGMLTLQIASFVGGDDDDNEDESIDIIIEKQLKEFSQKVLERGWVYLLPMSNIVGVKDFADAYFDKGGEAKWQDLLGGKSLAITQPLANFLATTIRYSKSKDASKSIFGEANPESQVTGLGFTLSLIDLITRYGLGVSTKTLARMGEGLYDSITRGNVEDFMNATTQSGVLTKLYASAIREDEKSDPKAYIERRAGVEKIVAGYSKGVDMRRFEREYADRMDEIMLYNTDFDYDKFKEDKKTVDGIMSNLHIGGDYMLKPYATTPTPEVRWAEVWMTAQKSVANTLYSTVLPAIQNWDEDNIPNRLAIYRKIQDRYDAIKEVYNADNMQSALESIKRIALQQKVEELTEKAVDYKGRPTRSKSAIQREAERNIEELMRDRDEYLKEAQQNKQE